MHLLLYSRILSVRTHSNWPHGPWVAVVASLGSPCWRGGSACSTAPVSSQSCRAWVAWGHTESPHMRNWFHHHYAWWHSSPSYQLPHENCVSVCVSGALNQDTTTNLGLKHIYIKGRATQTLWIWGGKVKKFITLFQLQNKYKRLPNIRTLYAAPSLYDIWVHKYMGNILKDYDFVKIMRPRQYRAAQQTINIDTTKLKVFKWCKHKFETLLLKKMDTNTCYIYVEVCMYTHTH